MINNIKFKTSYQKVNVVILILEMFHQLLKPHRFWAHLKSNNHVISVIDHSMFEYCALSLTIKVESESITLYFHMFSMKWEHRLNVIFHSSELVCVQCLQFWNCRRLIRWSHVLLWPNTLLPTTPTPEPSSLWETDNKQTDGLDCSHQANTSMVIPRLKGCFQNTD